MKLRFLPVFLLFMTTTSSFSLENSTITGIVQDEKGSVLSYANIYIEENNRGTVSDLKGRFRLSLKPGRYTVIVSFIGHETIREKIVLQTGQNLERTFVLINTAIQLGEITVVAPDEFIPREPETKSVIRSGEIEHMQASSLNDVLQLIPGEKTTNPTLETAEQASIRGGNSLGTQIIMDGVPISNNANLQIGIGYTSGTSGFDLRAIPAENIQEVEVIRGIPSAKYGDLVDGIMLVETKAKADPLRTKFKYNPHLYETNVSGGFLFHDWVINGNFNIALAERDIRVTGDGYTRIAGQITAKRETEQYRLKNVLYYTRAFDESKEKPGYALREAWYNRDYNIKYSGKGTYNFSQSSNLQGSYSISYTHQNSYLQQLVSRDNLVLSDRLNEGTQEGFIVFGTYLGKKWMKGDVWNIFTDLSYNQNFSTYNYFHSFVTGVTWRNDFNKGDGIIFDPVYPPILGTQAIRLRTYDELPHYQSISIYAEDKMTGRLIKPFTFQLGFRYEAYRPVNVNLNGLWSGENFIKSHNGSYFNPRMNFSYNIFKTTQLRMGYGATSKSPPLGMIFPGDKYFDIVDTVAVVDPLDPGKNFSLISTYLRDQSNVNLKGYKQNKIELSVDQQIGQFGFTITGFYTDTRDMFKVSSIPIILPKISYPDWPEMSTTIYKDTLFDDFTNYINAGWMKNRGIEISLKTKRLPVIQTVFSFDASYQYKESGTDEKTKGTKRYSPELGMNVLPFYDPYEYYEKDLLLNYRFDIQVRSLGIWITLHIQQNYMEINGQRGLTDILPTGYFSENGESIYLSESERSDEKYIRLRRGFQDYELFEENPPNLWLFNLKVSKSLWPGAEISFYVNNFFNHRPFYKQKRSQPNYPTYTQKNPKIFFGVEVSSTLGVL